MISTSHFVSIILPTYNRSDYLERSVGSVLNQTYQDWELIIWDDGSTDNSREVVMSFDDNRIYYFFAENKGAASARNQAISKAKGEYLAFLDSDDEWSKDKLLIQMGALQAHSEIDLIFSNFDNVNVVQNRRAVNFSDFQEAFHLMTVSEIDQGFREIKKGFLVSLASGNYIATDTVVVKRSVVQAYGGFSESLRNSEDFELWWRLGLNNVRMAFHDQVLMTRYKPQGSLTNLTPESAANSLKALDICAEDAISASRSDLVDYLGRSYRNVWQNMITARAQAGDRIGAFKAFHQSLKYGFRLGSLRLLVESLFIK